MSGLGPQLSDGTGVEGGPLTGGSGVTPSDGAFDPTQWSNSISWIDASDTSTISHSSGTVSVVEDKIGTYDLDVSFGTPQTGVHTIGGLNSLTFTGSGDLLKATNGWNLSSKALSVFVVVEPTDVSQASQGVWGMRVNGNDDTYGALIDIRTSRIAATCGTGSASNFLARQSATGIMAVNTPIVIGLRADTSNAPNIRTLGATHSGVLSGTMTAAQFLSGATTPCRQQIGARNDAGGFPLLGHIGEFVVYSDYKSDTDADDIITALKAKWGIS